MVIVKHTYGYQGEHAQTAGMGFSHNATWSTCTLSCGYRLVVTLMENDTS